MIRRVKVQVELWLEVEQDQDETAEQMIDDVTERVDALLEHGTIRDSLSALGLVAACVTAVIPAGEVEP